MRLVLAIDDDPTVLAVLRRTLSGLPMRLLCVASAEEALEIIGLSPPAVVVTDHQLPGMSGLTLLQELRSRWPRVRALLHTGDPAAQVRAAQLEFAVIEKGAHTPVLRTMVTELLETAR